MSKMIMTRGLPASGKTTWAKEELSLLRKQGQFATRVCRDDIREVCFGDMNPGYEAESTITTMRDAMIRATLEKGGTVIVDETLIRPKYIRHLVKIADEYGAEKVIEDFTHVPKETCITRNSWRSKRFVPRDVIERMAETLKNNENVDDLLVAPPEATFVEVDNDPSLPRAMLCDIDGTLAHMVPGGRSPYDWHRVGEDGIDKTVLKVLDDTRKLFSSKIILMSGRDGSSWNETIEWLRKYDVPYDELHMRAAGDQRADYIVKEELFRANVLNRYFVEYILDDRDQVVAMWRKLGLRCFQVAEGNF